MGSEDSTALTVEFKPDSSFVVLNNSGKYYIYSISKILFIQEDSTVLPFTVFNQPDSSVQLFSITDSVWYTLQKNK